MLFLISIRATRSVNNIIRIYSVYFIHLYLFLFFRNLELRGNPWVTYILLEKLYHLPLVGLKVPWRVASKPRIKFMPVARREQLEKRNNLH